MSLPPSVPTGLPREPTDAVPGELVIARAWKYDGSAHWVVPGSYLGADEYGHWILQAEGALVSRPGYGFYAASDAICLIPASGQWLGTFYDHRHPGNLRTYLDLSTEIGWRRMSHGGWEVNSVDMDLDVVRSTDKGLFIDDEDEFEEHSEAYGYPGELVSTIRDEADRLLESVRGSRAPFNGVVDSWFARSRQNPLNHQQSKEN